MAKFEFHALKLIDLIAETDRCRVLTFAIPEALQSTFAYLPGQHIIVRTKLLGEFISRSYSLCGPIVDQQEPSSANAVNHYRQPKTLTIAIKLQPHGCFSKFATSLSVGDTLEVMPPMGRFYDAAVLSWLQAAQPSTFKTDQPKAAAIPSQTTAKHYLMLAAGSGITPILANIEALLKLTEQTHLTLLYGNQTQAEMMFAERLHILKNQFIERFSWLNFFSKQHVDLQHCQGRITAATIEWLMAHHLIPAEFDQYFICGPLAFNQQMQAFCLARNIKPAQIQLESFDLNAELNNRSKRIIRVENDENTVIPKQPQQPIARLKLDGVMHEIDIDPTQTKSILDWGLAQKLALPHACKGGVCATCKAKLIKGSVTMADQVALTEAEMNAGFILTCQAQAQSDDIEVDYDDRH